jgi:hypothetical protein
MVVASLVTLAASNSNCSGSTAAIGAPPSPSIVTPAAAFVNSGSAQGDEKGSSGTGSSISTIAIAMVTDNNGDGRPNWGDSVTFNVSTTQPWDQVGVVCSQSGTVVLRAVRTPNAWSPVMLVSEAWQAGAAACVATLDQFNGTTVMTLAATSFGAGA